MVDAKHEKKTDSGALHDVEIVPVKGSGFAGMPRQDEWVRAADAVAMLKPILTRNSAHVRICERAHAGLIRARAEQFHDGPRVFHNHDIPKEFWWAKGYEALEQDWAAGDFSTWIDRRIELKAFGVTFARADIEKLLPPSNSVKVEVVAHTGEDEQIIDKLNALVPSAALSYKQAILDLRDDSRVSFRGPALELREALREILDHLAPNAEVKDRTGPTTKQKVRFILKTKGKRSSSDTPEQAVTAFEEAIAGLTRAVYELSSKATHVAGERQTVAQLRRYVVAILHDILEA
jgi:Predicted pPIWI-associating nuclease